MRDLATLHALYTARRMEHAPAAQVMVALAGIYDGKLATHLTELDEIAESSVPNIIAQGINRYAQFSAEMQPGVDCPPVRPNIASSRQKAVERAKVIRGWWQHSKMDVLDYQRFRYYYGFGAMPVIVRSDPAQAGVPRFHALNPIGVLPGPRLDPYSPEVPDCFVVTQHSAKWVQDTYGVSFDAKTKPDALLEVVEYIDAEQITVFCTGASGPTAPMHPMASQTGAYGLGSGSYGGHWSERGTHVEQISGPGEKRWLVTLSSTPNYAGVCTVSCPGVISLSEVTGFVNGILGKHKAHARLNALTYKAIAKDIMPDLYVEKDPNMGGQGIITKADGLRGIIGEVEGRIVSPRHPPGYLTFPASDRLESYQRAEAGIPASLGGEGRSNVRTGAAGSALDATTIDPVVREAHVIAQVAREHEARNAIALAKGYGGDRPRSFLVSGRKQTSRATYVATDLFENDDVVVRYPLAGTDLNGQTIVIGQSLGIGTLSLETATELNPLAGDDERARIRANAIEQVLLSNVQMMVQASPLDAADAWDWSMQGLSMAEITRRIQRRIQERQATQAPVGEPLGPAVPGSPEAQPGLGEPGVANAPTIAEPPEALMNLSQLVTATRRPQMTIPAERAG